MYCIKINFSETIFVFMNLIYDSLYFKMYAKYITEMFLKTSLNSDVYVYGLIYNKINNVFFR